MARQEVGRASSPQPVAPELRRPVVGAARLLRSSDREDFSGFFERLPLMCFTVGTDGTIRAANAHVCEKLGYDRDELIGQSGMRLVHPDDLGSAIDAFRAVLMDPGVVRRWELRLLAKDGSVRWVREANRALQSEGGDTLVMAVCEDLTEQRRAAKREAAKDRALQALTWRLAQAEERERRRVARGLHDDVGQLLALAKLYLGQVSGDGLAEASAEHIDEARRMIQQAIDSIRSLTFELSSPVLYEVGLDAALRGLGRRLMAENQIRFRFETDDAPRPLCEETRVALFRVGRELLHNVAKHARADEVRVSLANVGDHVELVVEDDGAGFDATEAGQSFGPAGGFGLFSIREQLDHIGGRLEVVSRPGHGTRVVASAPLSPQPEDSPDDAHPAGR